MSKINSLSNEKVLVAGANGMVGSSICRALNKIKFKEAINFDILAPCRKTVDFTDFEKVLDFFREKQPTIVIIAAAKVGGILSNSKYPKDFILENLRIQNNLIESYLINH